MSYVRWSSDNWRSDVYAYGVTDGFVTHVASNRVVGDIPTGPSQDLIRDGQVDEWVRQYKAVMDFLDTAEREPIGLPFDGESFYDPDLTSFLARLIMLRDAGYNVPDHVIADVQDEISQTGEQ